MANLAQLYHWTPETMDKMTLEELMQWYEYGEQLIDHEYTRCHNAAGFF